MFQLHLISMLVCLFSISDTVVTAKKQDGSSSPESGVADLGGNTKNFLTEHEKRMIQEFSLVNRQLSPDIGIVSDL